MKIVVAVTGASGTIYARQLIEHLLRSSAVTCVGVIFSEQGRKVATYEGVETDLNDSRIKLFDNDDMFSSAASGSANWDAMVVVPCSMGTLGRIANGISSDLIGRAADVMLKERRKLILVARETPLSLVHIRNMASVTEAGAIVMPACPSFYSHPKDIEELCHTVTERITAMLGVDLPRYSWGEE